MAHKPCTANTDGSAGYGILCGCAAQTTDRFPVVLILIQSNVIVRRLNANRDHESRRWVPLEFREWLESLFDEMLVEVRERRVELRNRVRGILITIRIRPVVPGADAENTPFHFLRQSRLVPSVPVTV